MKTFKLISLAVLEGGMAREIELVDGLIIKEQLFFCVISPQAQNQDRLPQAQNLDHIPWVRNSRPPSQARNQAPRPPGSQPDRLPTTPAFLIPTTPI